MIVGLQAGTLHASASLRDIPDFCMNIVCKYQNPHS